MEDGPALRLAPDVAKQQLKDVLEELQYILQRQVAVLQVEAGHVFLVVVRFDQEYRMELCSVPGATPLAELGWEPVELVGELQERPAERD